MNTLLRKKRLMYKTHPQLFEKLIAALSYMTFGTVGFVWLVLVFVLKKGMTTFVQYHVFQSIFLSIFYFIISALLGLIMQILSIIPVVNNITGRIYYWLNMPLGAGLSIINTLIYFVIFYLMLTSLLGKYSYLPWVSDIIKANIRR